MLKAFKTPQKSDIPIPLHEHVLMVIAFLSVLFTVNSALGIPK